MTDSGEAAVAYGRIWKWVIGSGGIAALLNSGIYLIAQSMNVPLEVVQAGSVQTVSVWMVLAATLLPAIGAAAILSALARYTTHPAVLFQVIALLVLLLSLISPLMLDVAESTITTLVIMHLVAAGIITEAAVTAVR